MGPEATEGGTLSWQGPQHPAGHTSLTQRSPDVFSTVAIIYGWSLIIFIMIKGHTLASYR